MTKNSILLLAADKPIIDHSQARPPYCGDVHRANDTECKKGKENDWTDALCEGNPLLYEDVTMKE